MPIHEGLAYSIKKIIRPLLVAQCEFIQEKDDHEFEVRQYLGKGHLENEYLVLRYDLGTMYVYGSRGLDIANVIIDRKPSVEVFIESDHPKFVSVIHNYRITGYDG